MNASFEAETQKVTKVLAKILMSAEPSLLVTRCPSLNEIVVSGLDAAFPDECEENRFAKFVWAKYSEKLISITIKAMLSKAKENSTKDVTEEQREAVRNIFRENDERIAIIPVRPQGEYRKRLADAFDASNPNDAAEAYPRALDAFTKYMVTKIKDGDAFNFISIIHQAIDDYAGKEDALLTSIFVYVSTSAEDIIKKIVAMLIETGDIKTAKASLSKNKADVAEYMANRKKGDAHPETVQAKPGKDALKVKLSAEECSAILTRLDGIADYVKSIDGWKDDPKLAQFMTVLGAAICTAPTP